MIFTAEGIANARFVVFNCLTKPKTLHMIIITVNNNCDSFRYSKQAYITDVTKPYDLPDGTPSFKDFMGSRNNRFNTPEAAQKNRIQPPAKVLHYFNVPITITPEELRDVSNIISQSRFSFYTICNFSLYTEQ